MVSKDAADDVGRVGELSAELAKLLPRAHKALATRLTEAEQATAALKEAETRLAAREEACAAAARKNQQLEETLKAREAELKGREAELKAREAELARRQAQAPSRPPTKAGGERQIDSLGMQILARATAAAMLRYEAK